MTNRTIGSLDGGAAARGFDLGRPPTPPSPSTGGAHFDLAELNPHVRTEREFKEWARNVRVALAEVQSR